MCAARFGHVACLRALREGSPGGVLASVNAVGTGGYCKGKTALDLTKLGTGLTEIYMKKYMGARYAADLPKSAGGGGGSTPMT
jgi:hypothetical protein